MNTNGTANQLGFSKIVSWIRSVVAALFEKAAELDVQPAEVQDFASRRAARLFAQALHENSNLEMDWLWYASNMPGDIERRYCLRRALEINPHSDLARSALAKLPRQTEATEASTTLPSPQAAGALAYNNSPRN
jgi:hypothetical protein